jgi:hypothetical protein
MRAATPISPSQPAQDYIVGHPFHSMPSSLESHVRLEDVLDDQLQVLVLIQDVLVQRLAG